MLSSKTPDKIPQKHRIKALLYNEEERELS